MLNPKNSGLIVISYLFIGGGGGGWGTQILFYFLPESMPEFPPALKISLSWGGGNRALFSCLLHIKFPIPVMANMTNTCKVKLQTL